MNSATLPDSAAYPAASLHQDGDADTSFQLMAGLAVGVLFAGAFIGALLYRARTHRPKSWYQNVRDEVAQQVAIQLKQLRQVASTVASEIERV